MIRINTFLFLVASYTILGKEVNRESHQIFRRQMSKYDMIGCLVLHIPRAFNQDDGIFRTMDNTLWELKSFSFTNILLIIFFS
jgi:hypothetical protein